ncbi:DeoR/GlpR family DNA-binding transcription regulator (plasmid) [Acuticoccus sp. MNP-M23]|uniref:DeoR/GlpR family DNA-binding transcription regulator n=1 Tax=Acuticoccus sp. MNP-M23 TaxID=3072793 RepID=UPI002815461B|nr:DeoR/GlpR family DNA-binding transcription regulator [Acuticoccus sp. MNP-M23]WMS45283.1 DeoR/GlpR family DNA-binding transcription regulator [Acuticoccus sp. MNP-M23]
MKQEFCSFEHPIDDKWNTICNVTPMKHSAAKGCHMNGSNFHLNNADAVPARRQILISQMLQTQDFLTVEALASQFDVTTQTIRRDINALCEQGAARRRHGGIARIAVGGNVSFRDREVLNRSAKLMIAGEVARCIPNGASVALGIGTTPQLVAENLLGHSGLKIVTNNLPIALAAAQHTDFDVAIAGGTVRNSDLDIAGHAAEELFAAYRVDFAIFGVAGVDDDGSLLDFSRAEVRIRQAMLRHCRQSFLVLDSSKFGRPAHVRGGRLDEASVVFCEAGPPVVIAELLAGSDTRFVDCSAPLPADLKHD